MVITDKYIGLNSIITRTHGRRSMSVLLDAVERLGCDWIRTTPMSIWSLVEFRHSGVSEPTDSNILRTIVIDPVDSPIDIHGVTRQDLQEILLLCDLVRT